MPSIPSLTFNDGHRIPQFGLGVYLTPDPDMPAVLKTAFAAGYRHIDTAAIYRNEAGVGRGIAEFGIARDELFVTTKLWNADQGYDSALRALDSSLMKLRLDHVDLYLIHWPCPGNGRFVESWKALVEAQRSGKARSIGVSNFRIEDLQRIIDDTGVLPAANQVELHPWLQQHELRDFHARHGIVTEAWSPLAQGGELLTDPALQALAAKHGKTRAQIVLRWHVQSGLVVFPKSANPARIRENIDVFDFALDDAEMAAIARLDAGKRIGPDPATLN
jgi:2,5-diketo-D-gluconate reductase A